MQVIVDWMSSRLLRLSDQEALEKSRPSLPGSLKEVSELIHFSVPVATGVSQAALFMPSKPGGAVGLAILVHGIGQQFGFPLWHWIESLASQRIAVLAFNWDGHSGDTSTMLDLQLSTRTLPLILQKLFDGTDRVSDRPFDGCFLVGHSVGASLCLLAATRPELEPYIKGVVTVSPAVTLAPWREAKRDTMQVLNPTAWTKDLLPEISSSGLASTLKSVHILSRDSLEIDLKISIDWRHQTSVFLEEVFERRRLLQMVKAPVLWVHGARDHVVPFSRAHELMSEIKSALFMHTDSKRGHFRTALSSETSSYISNFISAYLNTEREH